MHLYVTSKGIARNSKNNPDQLEIINNEYRDLKSFLSQGELERVSSSKVVERIKKESAVLQPLVSDPERLIIIGLNYKSHCVEMGRKLPEEMLFFEAPGSAITASGRVIKIPEEAPNQVDYEGEIAIIIGTEASNISKDKAWSVIAGISPINDVSARDIQALMTIEALEQAKGFPAFKPLGPCLITLDDIDDPMDISIRTYVNGVERQNSSSKDMIFSIPEIIENLTKVISLKPGDVICTGTPDGVSLSGLYPYLKAGDVVEVEVSGGPRLANKFVD